MGKKSAPPPPPDYNALAITQGQINRDTANEQTVANRPDQYTPWGSSTWDRGADGSWTQNVSLSPEEQAALERERDFNAQRQGMAGDLLDRAGNSLGDPLDLSSLPDLQGIDFGSMGDYGSYDPSKLFGLDGWNDMDAGFGAVEQVQKAMMERLGEGRKLSRESEINRLKAQGLPENSEAFQRAMERLDEGDTDAEMQALLAATSAYGDIFNRGLAENAQLMGRRAQGFGEMGTMAEFANRTRGQQFSEQDAASRLAGILRQQSLVEQDMQRQSPLNDFLKLTSGISPGMPQMPSFMQGTSYSGPDIYGAAQDTYSAQMDRYNAEQAQGAGLMGGLFGLAGSAIGGPFGGFLGKSIFG